MPVEIKELVIRAVVEPEHDTRREPTETSRCTPDERRAIIAAAVEQVLRILKRAEER